MQSQLISHNHNVLIDWVWLNVSTNTI